MTCGSVVEAVDEDCKEEATVDETAAAVGTVENRPLQQWPSSWKRASVAADKMEANRRKNNGDGVTP